MLQRSPDTETNSTNPIHRSARYLVLTIAFLCVLTVSTWTVFSTRPTNAAPLESPIESQLVEATNQQRFQEGLAPLRWNAALYAAATAKASDMLTHQYFDHIAPNGTTPWMFIKSRYSYESAGENLAIGFNNPLDAVPAWMKSPEHRANLLDTQFRDTGIALIQGPLHGKSTTIIVQMFGEPATNLTTILSAATLK